MHFGDYFMIPSSLSSEIDINVFAPTHAIHIIAGTITIAMSTAIDVRVTVPSPLNASARTTRGVQVA